MTIHNAFKTLLSILKNQCHNILIILEQIIIRFSQNIRTAYQNITV